jgi:hypothetical protein
VIGMSRLAIVCFTLFFLLGLTSLQKGNLPTVEASTDIYQGNERTNDRLLFQYFATYINDSFETGTYEDYATEYITVSTTMDFTQDAAHHGNYGMHCTAPSYDQSYLEYVWEPTINLVYARAMVRLNTNPLNPTDLSEGLELFKIRTYGHDGYRDQAATYVVGNASGQLFWTLSANNDHYQKSSATTITLGNWYCIELALYYNAAGWAKMWIDGAILDTYNWDSTTDTEGGIHFFDLGIYVNSGTATDANVDFDCTVVADSYIEAEVGSIPEYFLLQILPLLMATTLLTVALCKGRSRLHQ